MTRPKFDRFHSNSDACDNACEAAEIKEWSSAKEWLDEATMGSEIQNLQII